MSCFFRKITAFCLTDCGRVRASNEDECLADVAGRCFLVADGVGGANSGEIASGLFLRTAVELCDSKKKEHSVFTIDDVKRCFSRAHHKILCASERHPENEGMACTAELLLIEENEAMIGHIGDSRSYLFRNGELKQLTRDHTFIEEELEAGTLTPAQAKNHSLRHLISKAVGGEREDVPDLLSLEIHEGDLFLLCTDGLTDMVEDRVIENILAENASIEQMSRRLVEIANRFGGKDNISVLIVKAN